MFSRTPGDEEHKELDTSIGIEKGLGGKGKITLTEQTISEDLDVSRVVHGGGRLR